MRKYLILLPILSISFLIAQEEEEDINMDDLWDTTVWEEIEEINEVEGEVEQVVTVAGVRGAEAEDEALHHLYYRKSMKGPNKMERIGMYGSPKVKTSQQVVSILCWMVLL